MKRSCLITIALVLGWVGHAWAQDPDEAYRAARTALSRQAFEEAIGAFEALRKDYPDSNYVGDSYYWEAFALERDGELERAIRVIDELMRERPDAPTVEYARALRLQVCSELAQRGDDRCAEAVSSSVREADQLDEATRMAAVNALINMRADRAVPIAAQLAANRDQPVAIRKQALFILANKSGDADVATKARETLRNIALDEKEDREVRAQAAFWLSKVPGPEALSALSELVGGSADLELKKRAIFAISQHDTPDAMSLLQQLAENEALDTELRKQAIFWIGNTGGARALPFLTHIYDGTKSVELKKQILFAVSRTEAENSVDWLVAQAEKADESLETRKQALFWAEKSGLSVDRLNELYRSFHAPELRQHLIWLMADRGGAGSLDALLAIARTDPDPEMRKKAVFWIGQSNDPRAADYLIQLLGQ